MYIIARFLVGRKEGWKEERKEGRKENEMMVMIDRDGTNDGNNR